MLLWFVKIYERNLKKLQFTTQRFDTPVTPVGSWIATSLGYVHKFLQTRVALYYALKQVNFIIIL